MKLLKVILFESLPKSPHKHKPDKKENLETNPSKWLSPQQRRLVEEVNRATRDEMTTIAD
jgi:hypothetical protein